MNLFSSSRNPLDNYSFFDSVGERNLDKEYIKRAVKTRSRE